MVYIVILQEWGETWKFLMLFKWKGSRTAKSDHFEWRIGGPEVKLNKEHSHI